MNEMIRKIAAALYDKKAQDIVALDVSDMTVITDCMIIASGRSALQVKTLADEVEEKLSELGIEPHHIEGRSTSWILLDYTSVMVHVFHTEARNFYALERMWADGTKLPVEEILPRKETGSEE